MSLCAKCVLTPRPIAACRWDASVAKATGWGAGPAASSRRESAVPVRMRGDRKRAASPPDAGALRLPSAPETRLWMYLTRWIHTERQLWGRQKQISPETYSKRGAILSPGDWDQTRGAAFGWRDQTRLFTFALFPVSLITQAIRLCGQDSKQQKQLVTYLKHVTDAW